MPSSYGSLQSPTLEKMNNLEANSGRRGTMRGFSFGMGRTRRSRQHMLKNYRSHRWRSFCTRDIVYCICMSTLVLLAVFSAVNNG